MVKVKSTGIKSRARDKYIDSSPLWTVAEACDYLKVCNDTIYRWIANGSLPAIKLRNRYRIHKDDLDRITMEGMEIEDGDKETSISNQ